MTDSELADYAAAYGARPAVAGPAADQPAPPSSTQELPDPIALLAAAIRGELAALPPPPPRRSSEGPTSPVPAPLTSLTRSHLFAPSPPPEVSGHPGQARSTPPSAPRGLTDRLRDTLWSRHRTIRVPSLIGDLMLALKPAPVIVVTSRKGGVGKTAAAAAIAQVLGHAISDTTGTVAIVDQNIGNADQWGRLDLAANVPTVRDLVRALDSGGTLSVPTWASTPALAVYPESRESSGGYSVDQVTRFAEHLRQRHAGIVVDLPNRMPGLGSPESALCAAWIGLADLVLLPTTDDTNALTAVLEYLDSPSVQGHLVVVPYIASDLRHLRENARVVEMLDQIRERVAAVVPIPKSERATLAVVEGRPILEIDAGLRAAYVRLTQVSMAEISGRRHR